VEAHYDETVREIARMAAMIALLVFGKPRTTQVMHTFRR